LPSFGDSAGRSSRINNNGWIVGSALNTKSGLTDAFLLSVNAIPEPETFALMLLALGSGINALKENAR
jgi:hypothetical protein